MNESPEWVACVDAGEAAALAALRLIPGLEVALHPTRVWLRGRTTDENLTMALRKIPGLRRYTLLAGEMLLAEGNLVPKGTLPALQWQPLGASFPVQLPAPVPAADDLPQADLVLVRSAEEHPADAIVTDRKAWLACATTTAGIRLKPLRFAAARDGRVVVHGCPVPSLPGRRFYVREGVGVPCGWTWSLPLGTAVLRRWLALAEGDLALASPDGTWELIKAEQFVPASRRAARLTAEAVVHG